MRKWLNPRTGLLVAGALILVAVGIVYAIEISRDDIQGLFVLGTVQTPEETIRLFREGPPSTADLVDSISAPGTWTPSASSCRVAGSPSGRRTVAGRNSC